MKRNLKKVVLLVLVSLILVSTISLGSSRQRGTSSGVNSILNAVKPTDAGVNTAASQINPVAGDLLGVLQTLAVAIMLAGLMIAGVMMVMSAGDPKKKADAKSAGIAVLIGAFLIFAPVTIIKLIRDGANDAVKSFNTSNITIEIDEKI